MSQVTLTQAQLTAVAEVVDDWAAEHDSVSITQRWVEGKTHAEVVLADEDTSSCVGPWKVYPDGRTEGEA